MTVEIDYVFPDPPVVNALAALVSAYARVMPDDPIREDLQYVIQSIIHPTMVVTGMERGDS